MNERIRAIRKNTHLNMEQFGKRIGITKASVSRIESGENNPSDQTIILICKEFNINETWLRTGEGEMYDIPEDETAAIVSDLLEEDNPFYDIIKGIMKTYQQLDDKSQNVLLEFSKELLENLKEGGN